MEREKIIAGLCIGRKNRVCWLASVCCCALGVDVGNGKRSGIATCVEWKRDSEELGGGGVEDGCS